MSLGIIADSYVAGGAPTTARYYDEVMADSPALLLKLDEAGGGTVFDSSGNGRNGTATNMTWAQGSLLANGSSNSIRPNGTSAYIQRATWTGIESTSVTAEFRMRVHTGESMFVGRWTSSGNQVWLLTCSDTTLLVQINASGAIISYAHGWANGTDHTVALRTDGSTAKLFADGVEVASVANGGPTQTGSPIEIGRAAGTSYSKGHISGFAFWPSALSATRLAAHHAGAISTTPGAYDDQVMAQAPLFFWPMDEASFAGGQTLFDRSGNGRGLVLASGSGFSQGGSLLTSGVGGSLVMNGAASTYGRLTAASWLNPTSFTLTCLVNLRSGDAWHFNRWGVSAGQRDWVVIPGGWYSAWVGGSQHDLAGGSGVSPTISLAKHHIAYRLNYNGSTTTQTLFVDGATFATRSDSGSINTNLTDLVVGGDTTSTPVPAPLHISRVAHYSAALSDAAITALAAAA